MAETIYMPHLTLALTALSEDPVIQMMVCTASNTAMNLSTAFSTGLRSYVSEEEMRAILVQYAHRNISDDNVQKLFSIFALKYGSPQLKSRLGKKLKIKCDTGIPNTEMYDDILDLISSSGTPVILAISSRRPSDLVDFNRISVQQFRAVAGASRGRLGRSLHEAFEVKKDLESWLYRAYYKQVYFTAIPFEDAYDYEDCSTNNQNVPKRLGRTSKPRTNSRKAKKCGHQSNSDSEDLILDESINNLRKFKKKKQEKWKILNDRIGKLETANNNLNTANTCLNSQISKLTTEVKELKDQVRILMDRVGGREPLPDHPLEDDPIDNYTPPTPEGSIEEDYVNNERPRFTCIKCNESKLPNVYCNDCIQRDIKNSLDRLVPTEQLDRMERQPIN